jgi:hypothetical protein
MLCTVVLCIFGTYNVNYFLFRILNRSLLMAIQPIERVTQVNTRPQILLGGHVLKVARGYGIAGDGHEVPALQQGRLTITTWVN